MPDELLAAALDIAGRAADLAARRFTEGSPVSRKADGTEVTPADVEVERLIRTLIEERFPGDATYGEEEGAAQGRTGRRWVIDPINGTTLFVRRIPLFNMLLAVEEDGHPRVGLVSYPMTGEIAYATPGGGAWSRRGDQPPQRLRVSDRTDRKWARVATLNQQTWSEELLLALHREVSLMGPLLGTVGVAGGLADAMIIAGHPMHYEDLATVPLLIGEAGGRVTDLDGGDVLTGDGHMLASNGLLHEPLLDLIRGLPAGPRPHWASFSQGQKPAPGPARR
jgi:histidinol-phosphatase